MKPRFNRFGPTLLGVLTAALLFPLPTPALEITTVSRDFYYPNIFTFKRHIIGPSRNNKFGFEEEKAGNQRPDFFLISIKTGKEERGQEIRVRFEYKGDDTRAVMVKEKTLTISKNRHHVPFVFSEADLKRSGRVELWNVKVLLGTQVLAEHAPRGNRMTMPDQKNQEVSASGSSSVDSSAGASPDASQ